MMIELKEYININARPFEDPRRPLARWPYTSTECSWILTIMQDRAVKGLIHYARRMRLRTPYWSCRTGLYDD